VVFVIFCYKLSLSKPNSSWHMQAAIRCQRACR